MRYLHGLSFFLFVIGSYAQTFQKINELKDFGGDITSVKISKDDNFYAFSESSWKTYLTDSNLKVIREFNYDGLWGGGGPDFSFDNQYMAFVKFGEHSDTLSLYNLKNAELIDIPTEAYNLKFFHHSNKVLYTRNGHFNSYELEKKKHLKNVFKVGTSPTQFFSSYCISANDSLVFASTSDGHIAIYTTNTWQKTAQLGPFGDISNLCYLEKSKALLFNIGNQIYTYDLSTNSIRVKFKVNLTYISDIVAGTQEDFFLVVGTKSTKSNFIVYNPNQKMLQFPIKELKNLDLYGVSMSPKSNVVLIGGSGIFIKYRYLKKG
jgi:hypothetical protein